MVVCSSCRVRGFPNVIDILSIGVMELLWNASVIFGIRVSLCVAIEAVSVGP